MEAILIKKCTFVIVILYEKRRRERKRVREALSFRRTLKTLWGLMQSCLRCFIHGENESAASELNLIIIGKSRDFMVFLVPTESRWSLIFKQYGSMYVVDVD